MIDRQLYGTPWYADSCIKHNDTQTFVLNAMIYIYTDSCSKCTDTQTIVLNSLILRDIDSCIKRDDTQTVVLNPMIHIYTYICIKRTDTQTVVFNAMVQRQLYYILSHYLFLLYTHVFFQTVDNTHSFLPLSVPYKISVINIVFYLNLKHDHWYSYVVNNISFIS